MFNLDMRTVLVGVVLSQVVCATVMYGLWRANRSRLDGLGYWLANALAQWFTAMVFALRGLIPESVSIMVGGLLLVGGMALLLTGLTCFLGTDRPRFALAVLAVFVAVHAGLTFLAPSLLWRTINLSAAIAIFSSACARLLWTRSPSDIRTNGRWLAGVFWAMALLSIVRIPWDLVSPPGPEFLASGVFDVLAVMLYAVSIIAMTFGLVLLVTQRLFAVGNRDLAARQHAEQGLKTSEGRFRELFENINSGIAIYEAVDGGADFIFKDLNRAGEKIDGQQRAELVGRRLLEMRPGVKEFGLFDVLQRVYRTGVAEHHPVSLYKDERLTRWYDNFVCRLSSGEVAAVFDDTTAEKQGAQTMHEQIEELRRWHEVTVGREERIIELKREVNELAARAGERTRYDDVPGGNGKMTAT